MEADPREPREASRPEPTTSTDRDRAFAIEDVDRLALDRTPIPLEMPAAPELDAVQPVDTVRGPAFALALGLAGQTLLRGKHLDLENWRHRDWHPALDAAGIPSRRIYDLRHTFATHALAAGLSIFEVARFMGTSVSVID